MSSRDVVQYQTRLKEPHLPEYAEWLNISESGAATIREKYSDVYEIRELVERTQVGRAAELAKHLRNQADIFRQEDTLARGAKELEEAARMLEAHTLSDPDIRRLNADALAEMRARGIESFSIEWWPAFTRYILENAK